MEDLLNMIKEIIKSCDDLGPSIDPDEIKVEHSFRANLGFDSLALMTMAYEIQEKIPELDEMAIVDWLTVQDCLDTLKQLDKK